METDSENDSMQKNRLGLHGPELSEIGLGTWVMGGPWRFGWGPADDRDSIAAIQRALDLDINWIDTAPAYGLGHAEELVGQALQGRRDRVYIATKCGMVWNSKGVTRMDLNPGSIRQEVEASLKRLRTEVIDLYQFHWPDPKVPVEKSWRELIRLRKEGKIRWLGVSNFDVALLERCQAIEPVDSLQPPYNLLRREVEPEILPWCREHGVGVVAYSPMASGLLSGRFDLARLAADDWRRRSAEFIEPRLSQNLRRIENLKSIAEHHGKTVGQLAVAWVLRHPAVTSAIVGARTVTQAEENMGAAAWRLADEEMAEIDRMLAEGL